MLRFRLALPATRLGRARFLAASILQGSDIDPAILLHLLDFFSKLIYLFFKLEHLSVGVIVLLGVLFSYGLDLLDLYLLFSKKLARSNQNEVCVLLMLIILEEFTKVHVLNGFAIEDLRLVNHLMLVYK